MLHRSAIKLVLKLVQMHIYCNKGNWVLIHSLDIITTTLQNGPEDSGSYWSYLSMFIPGAIMCVTTSAEVDASPSSGGARW